MGTNRRESDSNQEKDSNRTTSKEDKEKGEDYNKSSKEKTSSSEHKNNPQDKPTLNSDTKHSRDKERLASKIPKSNQTVDDFGDTSSVANPQTFEDKDHSKMSKNDKNKSNYDYKNILNDILSHDSGLGKNNVLQDILNHIAKSGKSGKLIDKLPMQKKGLGKEKLANF